MKIYKILRNLKLPTIRQVTNGNYMNSSTEYDNYTFKYKILNNYKLDKNLSFLCVKEFTNVNIFHNL